MPPSAINTRTRSRCNAAPSAATSRAAAIPFQADAPTSPAKLSLHRPNRRDAGLVARDFDDAGDSDAPVGNGALRQPRRDRAAETDGLGEDERAIDAHPPAVEATAGHDGLAHGRAAEHDGFRQEQARAAGELDVDGAGEPHLVEQDGLLRHPGQCAAGADLKLHVDRRIRSERAVDFFRGRGGNGQGGAGADLDVDVEAVAAGHAAGGVDDDGLERAAAPGVGEADPQRTRLVHARTPARSGCGGNRKCEASERAIAREHVIAWPRPDCHFRSHQIAIARRSAPSSRLSRSQA